MALHRFQNSFTAGELTPLLDGRNDFEKYDSGCLRLKNMRPLPYGGATLRGGLEYQGKAKLDGTLTRLVPFNFSTGTRFVIEVGEFYMRFWYGSGGQVETSPGVPYEIATPYYSGEIFILQIKSINDVIYITHPLHPVGRLERFSDTNWVYTSDIPWEYPPLREENVTDTTITPSGTSGGITLTASASIFDPGMVGGYFQIRHLRDGDSLDLDISASSGTVTSGNLLTRGDWTVTTTERWYGKLNVERSTDGGSTWTVVRSFISKASRNVSASGTEDDEVLLRLTYTANGNPYGAGVWVGAAPVNYAKATASLEIAEAFASGLVKITGYSSGTVLSGDVIESLSSTDATDIWSEGAWSNYRGWPRAVGLFEQRLFFGGNSERPLRFWGSKSGDFENFTYGDEEDAAVAFDVASAQSNPINFLEGLQRLIIGTSGEELAAQAGSNDEPLTPTNISVRSQSSYGSELYQTKPVDKAILMIQRQGRKIREISYSLEQDGYVAPDLTILSQHLFTQGIHQLDFARQPDPLILASVNGEGSGFANLAVMTYNREQNITAWGSYETNGSIESACAVYGADHDEVWCVVRREPPGGGQYRYIEKFAPETGNKQLARFLDSHIYGTLDGSFDGTITGLDHLNGYTVRCVIAGANVGDYVVSSGSIFIPEEVNPTIGNFCVGLAYKGQIQSMRLDVNMANGPSQGKRRRISEATIRFYQSLFCRYGKSFDDMKTLDFRESGPGADPMDNSPPVFTGDKLVSWPADYSTSAYFCIEQEQPLPFTVLGVAVKAEILGD